MSTKGRAACTVDRTQSCLVVPAVVNPSNEGTCRSTVCVFVMHDLLHERE